MDVRQFIFFNDADEILFTRTDAESANWQVDELNLTCLFPYVPEKTILRGMRIAFEDDDGVLQPFEVRKVRNYEPDRYQEITCEHIVISELTDIHTGEQEIDGKTPSYVLSSILSAQPDTITGAKRWAVGNVTATATSSGDISIGSVWQNIRAIETNWNVYILPRVTWSASGITGRYLDIVPASGVWHGLRLSIDKNADELGVTVDDTEVKTALYGYGGNSYTYTTDNLDKTKTPINLVGYTWPGKPSGASINSTAGYIEDTAATAMYGRNGVPRFGFFQNGDISDQATLANKTWEALQTTNKPVVTVDCMVRDLYRMGYHDEKIRLHDTVLVELLPMNDVLQLEIIKLAIDLLDPTATRPTIGEYIPNIVYIQRQTAETASGGAGRGISGRRGGETETEAKWSEFQAEFVVNNAIMSYHAVQVDHDNKVLQAAGMDIDAQGIITYADDNVNMIGSKFTQTANRITQEVTDRTNADTTLQSNIDQEANKISLIVQNVGANGTVTAASIITSVNNGSSDIKLNANHIQITGNTGILGALTVEGVLVADDIFTSGGLSASETIYSNAVVTNDINVEGNITCQEISADAIDLLGGIDVGTGVYSPVVDVDTYAGYQVNGTSIGLGDAYKTITLSGPVNDVYTLTATKFNGDSVTIGNFSRAASSGTTLTGAWSGRYYTVTASPQGVTKTGIVYDGLVPTGSITKNGKNVSRNFIVYSDDGEGDADTMIMEKTVSINADSVYTDGQDSVVYSFTTASSVPSGITPTDLVTGTLRRYHVTKDGTDVVDAYYRVPNYSATLASVADQTTPPPTLSSGDYALYRTKDGSNDGLPIAYYRVSSGGTGDVDVLKGAWTRTGKDYKCEFYPSSGNGAKKYVQINTSAYIPGATQQPIDNVGAMSVYDSYGGTYVGGLAVYVQQHNNYAYITTNTSTPNYLTNVLARVMLHGSGIAEPRDVTSISQVILNSDQTTTSSHQVTVTYDDGETSTATVVVDASAITSVTQRIAENLQDTIVLTSSDIGTVTKRNLIVEYDNGTSTNTFDVVINAAAVYEKGRTDGAGQVVNGTITSLALYNSPTTGHTAEYNKSNHLYTLHVQAVGSNISNSPYQQDINLSGQAAYLQGKNEAGTYEIVPSLTVQGDGPYYTTPVSSTGAITLYRYGYDNLYYYDDDNNRYVSAAGRSRYWFYTTVDHDGGTYYLPGTRFAYYTQGTTYTNTYYTRTS